MNEQEAQAQRIASEVQRALAVLHAESGVNQQQRMEAQQYCEAIKARPDECQYVCLYLLSLPSSSFHPSVVAPAKHFALHGLQHLVPQRSHDAAFKQQIMQLAQKSNEVCGGMRFLQQTLARIVSDIAIREWPQRWPTLMNELSNIAHQGSEGLEMFAFVWRNLCEEVPNPDPMLPQQRRQELQQALMTGVGDVIALLQTQARTAIERLTNVAAANTTSKDKARVIQTVQTLLESMQAMLEWIPARHIFETGLLRDLCSYLGQPDLFPLLCDLLILVTARKHSGLDESAMQQLLAVWDAVCNWTSVVLAEKDFERKTEFINKIVAVLSNLIKLHGDLVAPAQYDGLKGKSLAVLGQLLNYRFQKISQTALELWIHIFRHHSSSILKPEYRQSLLSELLKSCCFRLMKNPLEDLDEQDFESIEEYNQFFGVYRGALLQLIALMAEMDPLLCFQVAHQRYAQLLSLPAPTDHLNSSGLCSTNTSRFLEFEAMGSLSECLFRSIPNAKFTTDASLRDQSAQLLKLVTTSWVTDDPLLQTRRFHVLGMFAPVLSQSSDLFHKVMDALMNGVAFHPPSASGLAWNGFSEDLKACRRRAISSLIQLARSRKTGLVVQHLLPIFPQLVNRVLELLRSGKIDEEEKIALFEFLVLIALEMRDQQTLANFLQQILSDAINTWTGNSMNALLAPNDTDPTSTNTNNSNNQAPSHQPSPFIQLLGANPEDQQAITSAKSLPASHRTASKDLRNQMAHILHTFMAVFKPMFAAPAASSASSSPSASSSTASPAGQTQSSEGSEAARAASRSILPSILPNVLRLLGHIYGLRHEKVRSTLPPSLRSLCLATPDQVLQSTGGGMKNIAAASSVSSSAGSTVSPTLIAPPYYHHLWEVRRWMDKVVDAALTILMLASKSGVAYFESLSSSAASPSVDSSSSMSSLHFQHLYAHLPHMHLKDARMLIDKYLHIMLNLCPQHLYPAVLTSPLQVASATGGTTVHAGVLPTVLQLVHQRIQSCWERVAASKQGGSVSPSGTAASRNNTAADSSSSSSSSSLSAEILEESELRELSRSIVDTISQTLERQYNTLHAASIAKAAAASVAADGASQSKPSSSGTPTAAAAEKEKEEKLLLQTSMCQLILTQQPLFTSVFSLLHFLISCPDSQASVKSIRLIHRLLPVALPPVSTSSSTPNQQQQQQQQPQQAWYGLAAQVYAAGFETCLRTMATAPQQKLDTIEAEVVALVKDMYVALVLPHLNVSPRQLLLSLPSSTPAAVSNLELSLGAVMSEKKHRLAMRSFLDRTLKKHRHAAQTQMIVASIDAARSINPLDLLSSAQPTGSQKAPIHNLQEKLVLPARPVKEVVEDVSGVSNLFQH